MSSAWYTKFKEAILTGASNSNPSSGTVKAALVDTGTYTFSQTHQFLSDLSGVVGTAVTMTTKTFTAGLFDADDVVFPTVTGVSAEAIVIYIDTGTAGTSRLMLYIDSATGLPVTPNGGDVDVAWDNGSNKIAQL